MYKLTGPSKSTILVATLACGLTAVTMASCGTLGLQTPEQSLTAAHQTHDALAKELKLAATSGQLKGPAASTAAQYLSESETYLTQADNALAAGQGISGLLGQANADMDKVQPLLPATSK